MIKGYGEVVPTAAEFEIEDQPGGRTLVVTGEWTAAAQEAVSRGDADGLELNYARGFRERDLRFLDDQLPIKRLRVIARTFKNISPIYDLANTLEALSLQTGADRVDLQLLPNLTSLAAEWSDVEDTIADAHALRDVVLLHYDPQDLSRLGRSQDLRKVVLKGAPRLDSLTGVDDLPAISYIHVFAAPRLRDLSALAAAASRLRELELEDCRKVDSLDVVQHLMGLAFLGISDCGDIESFRPVSTLSSLEILHAWGSTRVLDGDLTPLTQLPKLTELRMQDRREYRPRVREIQEQLK